MASYPDLPALMGSNADTKDGLQIDRAVNGTARGRSLWAAQKNTTLNIKHVLDATDKATLDAFYTANRALEITYTSLLATGNYLFVGPPVYKIVSPTHVEASVTLAEV